MGASIVTTALVHRPRSATLRFRCGKLRCSGEEALYQALLAWVEADTPWLHTKKERELYALELHSARIFELPEWVAKQEFEENYMPKRD